MADSTLYPGHGAGGDDMVDMDALRAKYSRPREVLLAEARQAQAQSGLSSGKQEGMAAIAASYDKLQDIVMCQACQALGTVKKQYGYRVIDEQCSMCEGEGVIRKGHAKLASEELKKKVRQVEAMVDECDDLDELERLASTVPDVVGGSALVDLSEELAVISKGSVKEAMAALKRQSSSDVPPAPAAAKPTRKKALAMAAMFETSAPADPAASSMARFNTQELAAIAMGPARQHDPQVSTLFALGPHVAYGAMFQAAFAFHNQRISRSTSPRRGPNETPRALLHHGSSIIRKSTGDPF